jgi:plasmid stabilization system protein ParE
MRRIRWSDDAAIALEGYLDNLAEQNSSAAINARLVFLKRAQSLLSHPFKGRTSRWLGLRELSVPRWRKILVYQVTEAEIIVIAVYDARQDLAGLSPRPE